MSSLDTGAGAFAVSELRRPNDVPGSDAQTGWREDADRDGEARTALVASLLAKNQELQAEINRLRAEREVMVQRQQIVMDLLAAKSPDRILHDLRNLLNERELYRTLANLD